MTFIVRKSRALPRERVVVLAATNTWCALRLTPASDMRPCVMRRVHAMCTHAALKVGRNPNAITEAVHTTPHQVGVQLGVRAAVLRVCVAGGVGGQLPGR